MEMWRHRLLEVMAAVEALIDFGEVILFFSCTQMKINGFLVVIKDTAGVRDAKLACDIEQEGMRRAQAAAAEADLKICVQVCSAVSVVNSCG
jgi:tRNA U34 5-carboxymethylaminomethyl modifying GTPase MnmE/TrmE